MSAVPRKNLEKLQYFQDHMALYTANAVAIGTTSTAVTALGVKLAAARAAYDAQQEALLMARNATGDAQIAIDAMATAGAEIIKNARAKAEATQNESIYTLAGLPIPSTPSPRPTPGTPYKFTTNINPDGSLGMKWKCDNFGNAGTVYQVYRKVLGSTQPFQIVGGTGNRDFTDTGIPAGVTQLVYKIQAIRSTGTGLWAEFIVNFGTNEGGTTTTSVQAVPVKIAA